MVDGLRMVMTVVMVILYCGNVFRIDICIPVAVDVWTIFYHIYWDVLCWVTQISLKVFGCKAIAFNPNQFEKQKLWLRFWNNNGYDYIFICELKTLTQLKLSDQFEQYLYLLKILVLAVLIDQMSITQNTPPHNL